MQRKGSIAMLGRNRLGVLRLRIMQLALLSALILPDMSKILDFSTSVGSLDSLLWMIHVRSGLT